jgi:hypothetical protein
VTSAAINILDADISSIIAKANTATSGKRGKWQQVGMDMAHRLVLNADDGQASIKEWHQECETAGMPRSTCYDVLAKLQTQGVITVDGEYFELPNHASDRPVSSPIQPL